MQEDRDILFIAEIPYEDGQVRLRYSRYMSEDGKRWIRHGRFTAFHQDGQLASEGLYEHGLEEGSWRDYHENGVLAAEGTYKHGKKEGVWRYWTDSGEAESQEEFLDGRLVSEGV
jgi:antitoxin component YwqK of YwqJK toxin-antitoxin module